MKYSLLVSLAILCCGLHAKSPDLINKLEPIALIKNTILIDDRFKADTRNFIEKNLNKALEFKPNQESPLAQLEIKERHFLDLKLIAEDESAETHFSPNEIKFIKRF